MADPSTSKSSSNDRNIPTITPHYPPECHDLDNNNANKKPSAVSSKLSVKPSRRVSFSETHRCYEYSPAHKSSTPRCFHQSSTSSSSNNNRHWGCGIRGCGCGFRCGRYFWCSSPSSRCCICCMWSCIMLLCLFFMVAVAFALFLIYFQPRLPVFRIERLDFSTFNISTTTSSLSQQKYLLSTDIELSVVASNVNEKIDFSYSPLVVYVSSGNVTLGNGEVPGFFQLATAYSGRSNMTTPTTTILNVRAGVSQSAVDIVEGERLRTNLLESDNKSNRKTRMMTNLDVILSGTVKFNFRSSSSGSGGGSSSSSAGDEMVESEAEATSKFPVSVLCTNIDMSRVALGYKPHCKVELFTFQVTNTPNVF